MTCAAKCQTEESGLCGGFTYHTNGTCQLYSTGESSTVSCACPADFSRCAGRCLIRPPQELNFTEAKAACVLLGAHLAVPRSEEENQCVLTMAAGVNVWMGLSEHGEDGVFVAEDGGEPVTLGSPFWGTGEPNSALSADNCVQIWSATQAWDDTYCSAQKAFVCQLQAWYKPECH
ncbi:type-2 ice-structuring protein-like [Amphibalanus amphitrite]|uniref:type-2 ice-structuring protein-like n=1 Tax=Amphibalanus amphitrite TaxID=1232801 RepID=UPI001C90BFA9|nr:type-2 ice-structuring protein-like [Amphibalanus amphitrite]